MRHLIAFFIGTIIIYIGFLLSFTGPQFALTAQPVYSAVVSAFTLSAVPDEGLSRR